MAQKRGPTDGKRFKRVRKDDEAQLAESLGMKRPGPGRPLEFNQKIADIIVKYISLGSYIDTAARAAGVSRDSFQDWMKKGGKGEEPFAQFLRDVEKAMAQSELRNVGVITEAAGKGHWQAAAWALERRYPKKYGRKVEISGDAAAPLNVNIIKWNGKEVKI